MWSCGSPIKSLWRRISLEFLVELPLLKARWRSILLGAVFQYVHAMSTQLAHRMHRPMMEPLHDIGFDLLPELGLENAWISELIFTSLFVAFILWTFSPFVFLKKRFYTTHLYSQLLSVLVVCQMLRIISFTVTQLPGPNYHCRGGEPTAVREMPEQWWGHLVVDIRRQATHGCGDLLFSSHTIFALSGMMTYNEYGTHLATKVIGWVAVALMSVLIVASRKHYTVDVVIAWYVVPLVYWTLQRHFNTKRRFSDSATSLDELAGEEDVEMGLPLKGVALAEGYRDHGSASPGESVKGHALYGAPRAGTVIGMIANGLNGSHGSSTPPCGFSAHGERLLVSALARLGLHVSPSSSNHGSGGPGTPARSSSGGADDCQSLRKGSPLSSIRTRLVGQADTGQSGMQRDEDSSDWGVRNASESPASSSGSGQNALSCSTGVQACWIS
ncbi:g6194 [Coccomyxa viridis]|uniref:G6194 protein n=1 Tax=Coccomyxa viridis TaxID=1274662 RepID=A0ABP1FYR2_9CHLO